MLYPITLIRPGQTEFDRQHRIQGSLDLPLTTEGEAEVEAILNQLQESAIEVLYTAPDNPALATAERIGQVLEIPVKPLEGLTNCDLGLWQGLTVEEIKRKYPKVYKQWKESPDSVRPPEGDENTESLSRAMKSLSKPLKREIPFGLVVSEPLATLLSCQLRQVPHKLPAAYCGRDRAPLVERLEVQSVKGEVIATSVGSS